jgi:hypothetical protein
MKIAVSEIIKKGLEGLLPSVLAAVLVLAALALIPLIWSSGAIEAGSIIVAGDDDETR